MISICYDDNEEKKKKKKKKKKLWESAAHHLFILSAAHIIIQGYNPKAKLVKSQALLFELKTVIFILKQRINTPLRQIQKPSYDDL